MRSSIMVEQKKKPIYKQWWFWLIIVVVVVGVGYAGMTKEDGGSGDGLSSNTSTVEDYTGKDAKRAYDSLKSAGYEVEFKFDRSNNGGFTDEQFQEFILGDFASEDYANNPYTVTKQSNSGKKVTLSVDYATVLEEDKEAEARQEALESKLGIVESMTACEQYGKQNYRNFKMHSIVGKIAETVVDENTWMLKYKVDANDYKDLVMECYVTGTSESPVVTKFDVY